MEGELDGLHEEEEGVPSNEEEERQERRGRELVTERSHEVRYGHQSTSGSLSLSLDSQPPGPSGFNLFQLPTVSSRPPPDNERHRASASPLEQGAGTGRTFSSIFQVPSSQRDSQNSLGLSDQPGGGCSNAAHSQVAGPPSHSSSHSLPTSTSSHIHPPYGHSSPSSSAADPLSLVTPFVSEIMQLSEQQRLDNEARREREHQDLMEILNQERSDPLPLPVLPVEQGTSRNPEEVESGGTSVDEVKGRQDVILAAMRRYGTVPVPGGTDTSLSSDEAIDRAVQAATRRHQEKRYSGVPESKLTTTTFTADQVVHMTTTESDDPQQPQQPPNFSSRRLLKLSEATKQKDSKSAATAPRQQSTVALTTGGTVPTSSVTTALTSTCGGRESSVEVLTAGYPVSGADTNDSSHTPGTQTTSSCESHSLSPLQYQSSPETSRRIDSTSKNIRKRPSRCHDGVQSSTSNLSSSSSRKIEKIRNSVSQSRNRQEMPAPDHSESVLSQDMFQRSQEDSVDYVPSWGRRRLSSPIKQSQTDEKGSRKLSRQNSSSSDQSISNPPPPKRQRTSRSRSGSNLPGWQKEESADQITGMSGQAQPELISPLTASNKSPIASSFSPLHQSGKSSSSPSQKCSGSSSSVQPLSSSHSNSSSASIDHVSLSQDHGSKTQNTSLLSTKATQDSPPTQDSFLRNVVKESSSNDACSMTQLGSGEQSMDESTVSTEELLNDPIFESIESSEESDVEVESLMKRKPAKFIPSSQHVDSSTVSSRPLPLEQLTQSETHEQVPHEATVSYMDEETQLIDSPELIQGSEIASSPNMPLKSPNADISQNQAREFEDELSLVSFESQDSYRLVLTQSPDTSPKKSSKLETSSSAVKRGKDHLQKNVTSNSSLSDEAASDGHHHKSWSDSTPPESGEGGGMGGDGMTGGGTGGVGETDGGDGSGGGGTGGKTDRGGGKGGAGTGDESKGGNEENAGRDKAEKEDRSQRNTTSHPVEQTCTSEQISLQFLRKGKGPLYESLRYDDSADNGNYSNPHSSGEIVSCKNTLEVKSQLKNTPASVRSNDSQPFVTSQLTSSGTPFQFQLPQSSLQQTRLSITPPVSRNLSQLLPSVESLQSEEASVYRTEPSKVTSLLAKDSSNTAVSPSEVQQDFFKSITPNSEQLPIRTVSHSNSDSDNAGVMITESGKDCSQHSATNVVHIDNLSPPLRKERAQSDTVKRKLLHGKDQTDSMNPQQGFLLGAASEMQDDSLCYDLTPELPHIEVPSDSQFQASQEFKTERPVLNQSVNDSKDNRLLISDILANDIAGNDESEAPSADNLSKMEAKRSLTPSSALPSTTNRRNLSINLSTTRSESSTSSAIPSKTSSLHYVPPFNSPSHPRFLSHSLSSPVSSIISTEFVSPSRTLSADGYRELKRQVTDQIGTGVDSYELRYVRTVYTVIEERIISSELIENDTVVPGSEKVWPESCRPYNTQEVKVEISPQVSGSSTPSSIHTAPAIILSPFTRRLSSPIRSPHSPFKLPSSSLNLPSSSLNLLPSPGLCSNASNLRCPLSTSHCVNKSFSSQQEKPHDDVPLIKLNDVPTKFQPRGNGTTRSQSQEAVLCSDKAGGEAAESDVIITDLSEEPVVTSTPIDKQQTPDQEPVSINNSLSGFEETTLPFSTPPFRKSRKGQTPSKVGTRLSLTTKTRTSPRKNIWTIEKRTSCRKQGDSNSSKVGSGGLKVSGVSPKKKVNVGKNECAEGKGAGVSSRSTSGPIDTEEELQVGGAVIARWLTDKRWYAAVIRGLSKSGRFLVSYADGEKGSVSSSQLFPQCLLKKNEPVMAGKDEDNLKELSGTFTEFSSNGKTFSLQNSRGEIVKCDTNRFYISQDTALKYIRHNRASPNTRKRQQPSSFGSTSCKKKRKFHTSVSSDKKFSPVGESDVTIKDLVSPSQNSLFQGYSFLLTLRPKEDRQSSSPDDRAVNKQHISSQIINRKGKVLEMCKDKMITDGRYFVLSDDCCRTQKYLIGLALAIPCVSYGWITDCIKQGDVIDYSPYRLHAGLLHKSDSLVEWTPRERSSILKGARVYIHHTKDSFKEHWIPILKSSGAIVLPKLPSSNRAHSEKEDLSDIIVISQQDCKLSSSITRIIELSNMKVLCPEWIVQCLIQGRELKNYSDFLV